MSPEAPIVTASEVPAAPATATETEKPQAPAKGSAKERMYTVKINGKEEQWTESKVLERAQKNTAAENALEEAAKILAREVLREQAHPSGNPHWGG